MPKIKGNNVLSIRAVEARSREYKMSQKQTVSINGRQYDPVTGLVMDSVTPVAPVKDTTQHSKAVHSVNVHSTTQKSQTLRRASLVRPVKPQVVTPQHQIHKRPAQVRPIASVTKSPQVTKFAPHPVVMDTVAKNHPKMMDIAPVRHPHVVKAHARQDMKAAPVIPKQAHEIKQEAISTAISNAVKNTEAPKRRRVHPRAMSIITAAFALVLFGGYLTYLNMPSLSVRVAAAAAGIDASYPDYRPDGYQLSGPVGYASGQVSMNFAANAGPQDFTIRQTKSSWDSAAVLDNYVSPKAGAGYITYNERGLTIYTFGGNAAWVNGGILYTIEGNAPLSSEQIRHIATSFI